MGVSTLRVVAITATVGCDVLPRLRSVVTPAAVRVLRVVPRCPATAVLRAVAISGTVCDRTVCPLSRPDPLATAVVSAGRVWWPSSCTCAVAVVSCGPIRVTLIRPVPDELAVGVVLGCASRVVTIRLSVVVVVAWVARTVSKVMLGISWTTPSPVTTSVFEIVR